MDKKWRRIKIGDLGRVVTGNTPPKKDKSNYGGPYPFIKPTDMTVGHRRCNEWEETYSEKAFQRYHRAYIPPGSTGVVTIGTVGEKLFQSNRWCFTNQSVNVVIPHQGQFDPDFVYYLMKVSLPKVENANPGTASGRHHVSKSNFESIGVDVPSYERQQKIGAVLSAYDELIENNLKRIKLLEEKAQQTYEEWFVRMRFPGHESTPIDPVTGIPKGWSTVNLAELVKMKFGYSFKARSFNSDGEGVPIIRCRNVHGGKTKDFTTEVADDKYIIERGELLIAMDGVFYVNVWTGPTAYLVQRVCSLVAHDERQAGFLTEAIKIPIKKLQSSIDGATVAHLGKKHLGTIEIALPPEELDISVFNALLEQKLILSSQIDLLEEARDILLPRLMTGVIDVEELDVELPMNASS